MKPKQGRVPMAVFMEIFAGTVFGGGRKLLILACALIGICAAIAALALSLKRDTVAYHVERLRRSRQNPEWKSEPKRTGTASDFIRPQVWLWYLHGAPTLSKVIQEREEHQQALIRLGYYDRREFIFTHPLTNRMQWADWYDDFRTMADNTGLADTNWWLHFDFANLQSLRITASKKDIPTFERIVSKLDSGVTQ